MDLLVPNVPLEPHPLEDQEPVLTVLLVNSQLLKLLLVPLVLLNALLVLL